MKTTANYLAVMTVLLSGQAGAAGFALNEQSIKAMGSALAGRASAAADATTLYTNPAGMTLLDGAQLSGSLAYIYAPADINNAQGFPTGTNEGDMIPPQWVGSGFYTTPLSPELSAGIGVYAPFGLSTNYESSFQGRYFGDKSEVRVISIQPTLAYKVSPTVSLGLGVTANRIDGLLSAAITAAAPNGAVEVEGDDMAWGYNAGVLWQPMPETRVGLSYRSKVKYTLEGTTEVRNAPSLLLPSINADYDASLDIATPATWDLSLSHQLNPMVTLHADVTRTEWSSIESLNINNAGASGRLATIREELDWKDVWFYSVGADWKYRDDLTLRAGIGFDNSPITDEHRSVRVPSEDRRVFTVGLSYAVNDRLSLDGAYMYLKEKSAHVDVNNFAKGTPERYSADYDGEAHLVGVQMNLKF